MVNRPKGFVALKAALAAIVLGALLLFNTFWEFGYRKTWQPMYREATSNLGAIRNTQVAHYAEWNFWVGNPGYAGR